MKATSMQQPGSKWIRLGICLICLCSATSLLSQITTRTDTVGKLLNEWGASGTAAGLSALRYENRDGGHSLFDIALYPQLRMWRPAGEETGATPQAGIPSQVRQEAIFGNCSMAAPADKGGSLPRIYMLNQSGFDFLTAQYLRNNLFFFPEHQDYDPGYEGRGGWGDLYPANTPCTVISQGSSFTDKPFLQAFFSTVAAFPPETQEKLIKSHLLLPTLQSIFRRSNRMVQQEEDYFTGKAHPPVFDGGQIDEEKMINTAHLMTLSRVPPIALLEVASETSATAGQDYFETEQIKSPVLGTSPVALARIFRGSKFEHEMQIKATRSVDIMRRNLTFRWVLLQGDPKRVKIEPNATGNEAKVTIAWHPEMRAATGISTHRVDIALFVGNGFAWSAPAIMSFYMLPNEARFYNENGRLEEIFYDAGNPDVGLPAETDLKWLTLARRINQSKPDLGARFLVSALGEEAVGRLKSTADDLAKPQEAWRNLAANPENKAAADAALAGLQEQLRSRLNQPLTAGGLSLAKTVERAVSRLADVVDLYTSQERKILALAQASPKPTATPDLAAARQRLIDLQVLDLDKSGLVTQRYKLDALTAGEKYQLRQLNLVLLNQALLPEFLERTVTSAHADPRLTTPKTWRDVYRYGKDGSLLGWSRITNGRVYEFNTEGKLLPEGRSGSAREVKYVLSEKSQRLVFMPK